MGKLIQAACLSIALASSLTGQLEDLGPYSTSLPEQVVVVPLDLTTGHPIVEVMIDGLGPYRLIFDTGATGMCIAPKLAEELGLPVIGETTLGDPSNPQAHTAELVMFPELKLGDATFGEVTGVAWAPSVGFGGTTRGILGLPTFEDCLFTLDYERSELRIARGGLRPPSEDPEVVKFHRRDAGLVSVPLELPGGRVLDAHLDSGNQSTVFVPNRYEELLDIVAGSRRVGSGIRASGPVEFVFARLRGDLRVGPLVMRDPELRFDAKMGHGNLGLSFFQAAEVTVDLAQELIKIRPYAKRGVAGQAQGACELGARCTAPDCVCTPAASLGPAAGPEDSVPLGTEGVEVTFLANEGLLLRSKQAKVLIDAFVSEPYSIYGSLPEAQATKMAAGLAPFDAIDVALVSHHHRDHFQSEMACRFLESAGDVQLGSSPQVLAELREECAPDGLLEFFPDVGMQRRLDLEHVDVRFMQLSHGTGRFAKIQNLGHLIELGGMKLLHLGDAAMEVKNFKPHKLAQERIDIAFIPYWYFQSKAGLEIIEQQIQAQHLIAVHIPPKELQAVKQQLGQAHPKVLVFGTPMQSKRFGKAAKRAGK